MQLPNLCDVFSKPGTGDPGSFSTASDFRKTKAFCADTNFLCILSRKSISREAYLMMYSTPTVLYIAPDVVPIVTGFIGRRVGSCPTSMFDFELTPASQFGPKHSFSSHFWEDPTGARTLLSRL